MSKNTRNRALILVEIALGLSIAISAAQFVYGCILQEDFQQLAVRLVYFLFLSASFLVFRQTMRQLHSLRLENLRILARLRLIEQQSSDPAGSDEEDFIELAFVGIEESIQQLGNKIEQVHQNETASKPKLSRNKSEQRSRKEILIDRLVDFSGSMNKTLLVTDNGSIQKIREYDLDSIEGEIEFCAFDSELQAPVFDIAAFDSIIFSGDTQLLDYKAKLLPLAWINPNAKVVSVGRNRNDLVKLNNLNSGTPVNLAANLVDNEFLEVTIIRDLEG